MVDVRSKRCTGVDEGGAKCTRRPTFGVPGEAATHCAAHKTPGMVDVNEQDVRRCGTSGAPVWTRGAPSARSGRASARPGVRPPRTALRTRDEGGVKCTRRPTFRVPGGKGTHCSVHKTPGMVTFQCQQFATLEGH
eukprot:TRINITY_DN0_c0_g2_i6.p3 TRINITY_DN0_c0_g2~~TRINITY_DN0_c0_g2_i6.p3  ORF type:complete len:136 (-),score=8.05 TRINITY_DN0_c0_g2_i6:252-659(-)